MPSMFAYSFVTFIVCCTIISSVVASNSTVNTDALGPYTISTVTVSGVSSGAYMAVQMHIAYSMIISGNAAFAGGPFYCAEGSILYAETKCMAGSLGGPQVTKLVDLTNYDAKFNYIDDPSNLRDDKVFIYSGLSDTVILPNVVHALQAYYSYFMDADQIVTSYDVNSEHCLPTLDYGEACLTLSSPYLGKCNYDGAGEALQALYGSLNARVATADASRLFTFDQTPYRQEHASIADVGYIFVPESCENKETSCRLHVSFHGCHQDTEEIGNAYALHSGFNEWAQNNNIIVLYPMAQVSESRPLNPNGCWDWWGYTDPKLYGVKAGPQPTFVRNLIKQVAGF